MRASLRWASFGERADAGSDLEVVNFVWADAASCAAFFLAPPPFSIYSVRRLSTHGRRALDAMAWTIRVRTAHARDDLAI